MNASKRSYFTSKSHRNRSRESMHKPITKLTPPWSTYDSSESIEPNVTYHPIVKSSEISSVLPRYAAVLTRTADDGVTMKDLDQIQQELEKLLSTCAVRHRQLKSEVESIDKVEERREKRGKTFDKPPSKRRKIEEKSKQKDPRHINRILKIKPSVPVSNLISDLIEMPIIPKHDTSDRFWLSVDPYCQDISRDNVTFLDELIKDCNFDVKIPELGKHYAMEWSDDTIQSELSNGFIGGNQINECTKNLLPSVFEKYKSGDFNFKGSNGIKNGLCLERRLRKEGLIDMDELNKSLSSEDEILKEIKKCQCELEVVSDHNRTELGKLKALATKDLQKQGIKTSLEKVDRQILNMYSRVLVAKQKEQNLAVFEEESNAIIKQQVVLHRQLTELTDFSLLE